MDGKTIRSFYTVTMRRRYSLLGREELTVTF